MKRTITKNIFLAIIFFGVFGLAGNSEAANYYIAQNASGIGDASSCANAKAFSWNWERPNVTAGDTIFLCGSFSSGIGVYVSGMPQNPITIKFCKDNEANCGVGNRGKFSAAVPPLFGFIGGTGKSYIVVDGNPDGGARGIIEATDNGSFLGNKDASYLKCGVYFASSDHIEIKNLNVRNMYVHAYQDASYDGIGGNGSTYGIVMNESHDSTVHDCTVSNAGDGIVFRNTSGSTLSNNKIYNNSVSGCCFALGLAGGVANGYLDNTEIFNNDIEMGANWMSRQTDACCAARTCDCHPDCHLNGLYMWSGNWNVTNWGIRNLKFYNNYIHGPFNNPGGTWISTSMVGNDGNCHESNNAYFNNLVVLGPYANHEENGASNGMMASSGNSSILNNTIVGYNQTSPAFSGSGTLVVKNNIFKSCAVGLYVNSIGLNITTDNNLFYDLGSVAKTNNGASETGSYSSLTDWRNFLGGCSGLSLGRDCNSLMTDPRLTMDYKLSSDSSAIGMGANLTNVGVTELNFDKIGNPRPAIGSWDIGAYEYNPGGSGDITAPAAPSGLSVR